MSDVPVVAAWMIAFAAALSGTSGGALVAGIASACAILIRINHGPFAGAILLWFALRAWRRREADGVGSWKPLAAYLVGVLPGVIGAAAFNWYFHGSPFRSGYGVNDYLFRWENVVPNLARYPAWITETQTPLFWLGVVALAVPLRRWWANERAGQFAAVLALFSLLIFAQYIWYGVFDAWWYLRFLLAAFPAVFIATGVVAAVSLRALPRRIGWVLVVLADRVGGSERSISVRSGP
jgi:hypothetical protein